MKKVWLFGCFLFLIMLVFPFTLVSQEKGDVDENGAVDIVDALLIAQYYVGLEPSPFNTVAGDVDCSGVVDIIDALMVAQFYVGLLNEFTGCDFTTKAQLLVGGSDNDYSYAVKDTPDGGFLLAGTTFSIDIPGTVHQGDVDCFVIKYTAELEIEWQKLIGGNNADVAYAVELTPDDGYIIAGSSNSTDIQGLENKGSLDAYIIKLDASGHIVWQKMYGGSDTDIMYALEALPGGGYVCAGFSGSRDIDGLVNRGNRDYYVMKINDAGDMEWQKMFGGSLDDGASSVAVTPDFGCLIAGYSLSLDIPGTTGQGAADYYIVKLDSDGILEWQALYGGEADEEARDIEILPDNGFIVTGTSSSATIPGCTLYGTNDMYLIRCDSMGNIEWQDFTGGNGADRAYAMDVTDDNGYLIAGVSSSTDISGCTNSGGDDALVVKVDQSGRILWQEMKGGEGPEFIYSVAALSNNRCVAAGYTRSSEINGTAVQGEQDCYILVVEEHK